MGWTRNKRRNHNPDAARFISALRDEFTAVELASRCGVSEKTIRRWSDGTDHPSLDRLYALIDSLYPLNRASGPVYSQDLAIDGGTRVGGVGQYTLRAASGNLILGGANNGNET